MKRCSDPERLDSRVPTGAALREGTGQARSPSRSTGSCQHNSTTERHPTPDTVSKTKGVSAAGERGSHRQRSPQNLLPPQPAAPLPGDALRGHGSPRSVGEPWAGAVPGVAQPRMVSQGAVPRHRRLSVGTVRLPRPSDPPFRGSRTVAGGWMIPAPFLVLWTPRTPPLAGSGWVQDGSSQVTGTPTWSPPQPRVSHLPRAAGLRRRGGSAWSGLAVRERDEDGEGSWLPPCPPRRLGSTVSPRAGSGVT